MTSQQTQRVVKHKTDAQLAHDALQGIIYQPVRPFSRPPPFQSFIDEARFRSSISQKHPDIPMPNPIGQDADEATVNDELSKPVIGQRILERRAAIEEAARFHAARFLNSDAPIADNIMHTEQQSTSPQSQQVPRIAPFQSDRPPLPLMLQTRGIGTTFSHIPARVACNVPNLAECLIKWHQEVGGQITELARLEFWSSRSFGTKPFFYVDQGHVGFQKIQKVEIDIPTINQFPGLSGKWTFFYLTGKQWQQFPNMPVQVMAILIAREMATRQALRAPMDLPVRFRKGEHVVIAFPSSYVASRQEYYHDLAMDRIFVSIPRGKQRADDTLKSRAAAMRKARSKYPMVYRVETIESMRGGRLPLMDGHGIHVQLSGFDRLGKEFGDGTLRMQYWEKRVVPLDSV